MKPKPINIKPVIQDTLEAKKVKIETPIGSIESDSGNHFVDVLTVLLVVFTLYAVKRLFTQ